MSARQSANRESAQDGASGSQATSGEKSAAARDELLSIICAAVPVAGLVLEAATGKIRHANEEAAQLLETSVEWLIGRSLGDICADPDEMPNLVDLPSRAGGVASHELRLKCADGSALWITVCMRAAPAADRTAVLATLVDVEDLRQVEQTLADTAAELAAMSGFPEMNPGPVYRLDLNGTVVLANAPARGVFGDTRLLGKSWFELCPEIDRATWQRVLQSNEAVTLEADIHGQTIVLTHTLDPSRRYVFVYGTDLTDQRAAERALHEAERMATVGTLAAGIAHEMNNPVSAAQRAAEQIGAAMRDLSATQIALQQLDLPAPEWERLAKLDHLAGERAASPLTATARGRAAHEAKLEDWLDESGVEDGWRFAADLADLGLAVAELADLATDVGREQLAPIIEWLTCRYSVYSLAEQVRSSSSRVANLVDALKAHTFLDQAPVQSVSVPEGLENALALRGARLEAGIAVKREFASDLPTIEASGSELNQVWTNLIDNAIDAMNGQGTLVLRTYRDGDSVVVEIEDSGAGIPDDIRSRIFDPFFTTKPPGMGPGLGLTTARNIVANKHQGSIDVDSEPGRTTFRIKLPQGVRQ